MKPTVAVLLASLTLAASSAQAAFTPISIPKDVSYERDHAEILAKQFGGVFTEVGNDFSNGDVYVTRVDDDDDQVYSADSWSATVLAAWAGAEQSFGTIEDGLLLDVLGRGGNVQGEVAGQGGDTITFARFGHQLGTSRVSTNVQDNYKNRDYVVTYTYSIGGEAVEDTYLLFFEDLINGDFDYNDLVVEVKLFGDRTGPVVPEPGSLALLGLGAVAMLRRRRRGQ